MKPTDLLNQTANISVDVDGLNCYRAIHGLPTPKEGSPDPIWTLAIPRILRLFREFHLPATFFIVGKDLEIQAQAEQARALFENRHELANHTFTHPYDLRRRPPSEIVHQIRAADDAIEAITSEAPKGFRTPGYNLSAALLLHSRQQGHLYDASLFPCSTYWTAKAAIMGLRTLLKKPSRSDRTDPRTLLGPREPYFPAPLRFWESAPAPTPYIEFPITVAAAGTIPLIGTTLHILDLPGWHRVWPRLHQSFPAFLNLEFHGIDFLDGADLLADPNIDDADDLIRLQQDLKIPWSKKEARYRRVLESFARDRRLHRLDRLADSILSKNPSLVSSP